MDKYHIYEEIGKGDFSQVFKGREKKKIEYVAIKRVEKSMMSKVRASYQGRACLAAIRGFITPHPRTCIQTYTHTNIRSYYHALTTHRLSMKSK